MRLNDLGSPPRPSRKWSRQPCLSLGDEAGLARSHSAGHVYWCWRQIHSSGRQKSWNSGMAVTTFCAVFDYGRSIHTTSVLVSFVVNLSHSVDASSHSFVDLILRSSGGHTPASGDPRISPSPIPCPIPKLACFRGIPVHDGFCC